MKQLVLGVLLVMNLLACGENGPRPKSMIGWYNVSLSSVKEPDGNDKQDISVKESNESDDSESSKSASNAGETEILQDIDTSTIDGEIKYSARQFETSIKSLSENVSTLGEELSDVFNTLAKTGLNIKNGLLEDIRFDAELQEDGDIKIKEMPVDIFQVSDATWAVDGKQFFIFRGQTDTLIFDIVKKSKSQILLQNKDIAIKLDKIK